EGGKEGWKRVSTLTPNFAYGQDVVKAFDEYFPRVQQGGKVLAAQFPPFGEKNFQPYINAVIAPKPDAVVGGLFSTDILTFWKQWLADGIKTPNLTLSGLPNLEAVKEPGQMPPNSFGFIRGWWQISNRTPVGAQLYKLYAAKYGKSDHPVPSAWSYEIISGYQMAKALIEKTKSLDPKAWIKAVEAGNFSFNSPYHAGPT